MGEELENLSVCAIQRGFNIAECRLQVLAKVSVTRDTVQFGQIVIGRTKPVGESAEPFILGAVIRSFLIIDHVCGRIGGISHNRGPGRCIRLSIDEFKQLIINHRDCQRDSSHIQRSDQRADDSATYCHTQLIKLAQRFTKYKIKFEFARATESVDQQQNIRALQIDISILQRFRNPA